MSYFRLLVIGIAAIAVMSVHGIEARQLQQGRLSLSLAPSALPADGKTYSNLFVQLLSEDLTPRHENDPVRVFLSSSDSHVASVPDEVIVPVGSSYVQVPVSVLYSPGQSVISALASGYENSDVEISTANPLGAEPPLLLSVTALPPTLRPGDEGIVTVAITDRNGVPYLVPHDVHVVITSSDTSGVEVPQRLVIPASGHIGKTSWKALDAGNVDVLAQADTFESGVAQVNVVAPEEIGTPVSVEAYPMASSMPASPSEGEMVVLQALDSDGLPVAFPCTDVFVTSSSPTVASATAITSSPCDSSLPYITYSVQTSATPGEAALTVGAGGLGSSAVTIATHRLREVRLEVSLGPTRALAQDVVPTHVVVQLIDEADRPVVFHDGYEVMLVGRGVLLPDSLTIPQGESFVLVPLTKESGLDGEVSIVATASEVQGGSITFDVVRRILDVSVNIPALNAGQPATITAEVTSEGEPVPGAEVVWAIVGVLSEPVVTMTGSDGMSVLELPVLDVSGRIPLEISATSAGFESSSTSRNVTISGLESASEGRSRLPFILVFALACFVLAGYIIYNSRVYEKLTNRISLRGSWRPNRQQSE